MFLMRMRAIGLSSSVLTCCVLVLCVFVSSAHGHEPAETKGESPSVLDKLKNKLAPSPTNQGMSKPSNSGIELTVPCAEVSDDEAQAACWKAYQARLSSSRIELTVPCAEVSDDETQAACWKAYRARLAYYETGLAHRTGVFWWQHVSTQIIFIVVLTLVFVGIYFAWIQFRRDMSSENGGVKPGAEKEHSIELSTSGIKVTSPVLGVILLALSLAFFYLYLVYVYPIEELF